MKDNIKYLFKTLFIKSIKLRLFYFSNKTGFMEKKTLI
ncbi:hypothetical protein HMPREF1253_0457 [Peptoniphilus sp. BV3C26]|nr:hypothetical protein HMPREF1253_0457 [Peptoniphilus sp. BV3C26]